VIADFADHLAAPGIAIVTVVLEETEEIRHALPA
jgi:hypothetical protein